jgi:hypothetical protein
MFEMDSYVAVDVLGLSFMKGDQPHAGFPEASYTAMAEQLARAGYRVVVVEQVRGRGGVSGVKWQGGAGQPLFSLLQGPCGPTAPCQWVVAACLLPQAWRGKQAEGLRR